MGGEIGRGSRLGLRAVAVGAAMALAVALATLAATAPGQARLVIEDDVDDVVDLARQDQVDGPSSVSVPPGQAQAPARAPAAAPVSLALPEPQAESSPDPLSPAVADDTADDTLVVPDGQDTAATPDGTEATLAPAPPTTEPTTPVGPGEGDTPAERFASRFPAHVAAEQSADDPSSSRWAVLIGVNEHAGTTRDNIGSRQDAESLYSHLLDMGWADDHVLLLTDGLATRETIVQAIDWLADKTDDDSVAVFSYSGHAKQWPGQDMDGDGEVPDEALWPTDNQHIVDGEFVEMMSSVQAGRLWLNFMACEGAGFLDPGLTGVGRVVTYSSAEVEKSYEDPSVGHSVWGWNLTVQGLRLDEADTNEDGEVTVQEATAYAIPRAAARTSGQRYGAQNGGMVDQSRGAFSLAIPPSRASGG